jgi:flagellar hook-length control protein FliK
MITLVKTQSIPNGQVKNISNQDEIGTNDTFEMLLSNILRLENGNESNKSLQETTNGNQTLNLDKENLETQDNLQDPVSQEDIKKTNNNMITIFAMLQNIIPSESKDTNSSVHTKSSEQLKTTEQIKTTTKTGNQYSLAKLIDFASNKTVDLSADQNGQNSIELNPNKTDDEVAALKTNQSNENAAEININQNDKKNSDFAIELVNKDVQNFSIEKIDKNISDLKISLNNDIQDVKMSGSNGNPVKLSDHEQSKVVKLFQENFESLLTNQDGKKVEIEMKISTDMKSQDENSKVLSSNEVNDLQVNNNNPKDMIKSIAGQPKAEIMQSTFFLNGTVDYVNKQRMSTENEASKLDIQNSSNDEMPNKIIVDNHSSADMNSDLLAKKQNGLDKSTNVLSDSVLQVNSKNQNAFEISGTQTLEKNAISDPNLPVHSQVSNQILNSLKDNHLNFKMKLNPEGLGQLTVHISYQNGKVSLDILANTTSTQKLLMGQIDDLKTALQSNNVDVSKLNISCEKGDFLSEFNNFGSLSNSNYNNSKEQNFSSEKRFSKELFQENDSEMNISQMNLKSGIFNCLI